MIDGSEVPLSHASRTLLSVELNCAQLDKEAAAVIFDYLHRSQAPGGSVSGRQGQSGNGLC